MFAWTKRGLVFEPARHGVGGWMQHSALTPTRRRPATSTLGPPMSERISFPSIRTAFAAR